MACTVVNRQLMINKGCRMYRSEAKVQNFLNRGGRLKLLDLSAAKQLP